jgi:hypothetical protein
MDSVKRIWKLLTCLTTATLTTATIGLGAPSDKTPPIMYVNGIPVFQEDYKVNETALRSRLNVLPNSPLKSAVIENLAAAQTITYRGVLEAAKIYSITSEEQEKYLNELRGQVPLAQFQQNITAQGYTWEAFLEELRQRLQVSKLIEAMEATDVSQEELEFFHANSPRWNTQPLEKVLEPVQTQARISKASGELSLWVQMLSRQSQVTYPDDSRELFVNPVVASVEGVDLRLDDLSRRAYYSWDFFAHRYSSKNTKDPYQTWFSDGLPKVLESMIDAEVAAHVAAQKGLAAIGDPDQILALMNTYQKRQVRLSEAEIRAFYAKNSKNYMNPADALVTRIVFDNAAKANAFRQAMLRGATDVLATARKYTTTPISAYLKVSQSASGYMKTDVKYIFANNLPRVRGGRITAAYADRSRDTVVCVVHEVTPATPKPLAEVRQRIVASLTDERTKDWVKTARKGLKISNNYKAVLLELAKREVPDSDKSTPVK